MLITGKPKVEKVEAPAEATKPKKKKKTEES